MPSIIIGIVFILFTVFACLPKSLFGFGLEWGEYILNFLKGATPVVLALVGIVAVTLGIADVRDKREAKREEEEFVVSEKNDK